MVNLWGRPWTRRELLARVGRLDQHHITWRQLGTGTYVVAMEPSTNRDAGRLDARARGELQHLAAGEERRYTLEIGALVGIEDVDAFTARARLLAADASVQPART
jgi:uncharacterized protein DUF4432